MATKASKLCSYVIKQIGKPYWYGTAGQKASETLYKQMKKSHPKYYKWTYSDKVEGIKVHDCSGLISAVVNVKHGATSQYKACSTKSSTTKDFPGIPGTLVFKNDKDGGKYHVGVYIGNLTTADGKKHTNAVVEAMGHKWGVVVSSWPGSWDSWGQLKSSKLTYDTKKGQSFIATKSGTSTSGGDVDPQSLIKVSAIDPYIATIPPIKESINYANLKKYRVSGMMFNAGSLYDSSHRKKTYQNPYLNSQIKRCMSANLSFALYADVKAHNEIEADAECRALYYTVSEYSPELGLWLYINTQRDQEMNDKIINVYYKYIELWGLKHRCGIYIEISRLSMISWSKFQDKFYLWGIDKSLDFKNVEGKLLQPSMFEVK